MTYILEMANIMTKKPKLSIAEQNKLKLFLARRHPEYNNTLVHWEFLRDCYEGGREWFKKNIFRYIKEGDKEYGERVTRAYRFNHTREVVDLVDKYLFKMEVARNDKDAPDYLKSFWASATLNKNSIEDYVKQISKNTSIYGRIWIVVDNNKDDDEGVPVSVAQAKEQDSRTYSYFVTPENVPDLSYDEDGCLNWILIHEETRDDEDPITSTGEILHRFRLWTKNDWTLYTLKPNGKQTKQKISATELAKAVVDLAAQETTKLVGTIQPVIGPDGYDVEVDGPHTHSFGEVPVFHADNMINSELYKSQSMIDDVAYLDRSISNYLSNLDAIIQDQTFSQLIIPAQGILPGEDGYDKIISMGTSRIFTYDGESGNKPEFISPDVKQAEVILKVINKIINEIYHTVGLSGERTKEDNALGIDNSSGVAKAYDFERVNSLLASKASSLEFIENKINQFVMKWNGDETTVSNFVLYPQNFDVRGLYDEFEIATNLSLISAPISIRKLQMNALVDKLFPKLAKDVKAKIESDIESWVPPVAIEPQNQAKPTKLNVQGQNPGN